MNIKNSIILILILLSNVKTSLVYYRKSGFLDQYFDDIIDQLKSGKDLVNFSEWIDETNLKVAKLHCALLIFFVDNISWFKRIFDNGNYDRDKILDKIHEIQKVLLEME